LLKDPQADLQWRAVLLYFVRGWTSAAIAARFHVPAHRIWHTLNQWAIRAIALGYIQVIDMELLAACSKPDAHPNSGRTGRPMRRNALLFGTGGGHNSAVAS
jgi:hypothetical protein